MRKILFSLLIFIVTLPVFAENTILVVGDSISAAHGLVSTEGWVELLRKRLQEEGYPYQVINASISGDTTGNALARTPQLLKQHHPQVTIFEVGGNDGLRGLPLRLIRNNLESLIKLAQEAGSKVLVLGVRLPPNYGPAYIEQFQEIFTTLAKREDLRVVPLFLQKIDENPELMQADRIHPTVKAQVLILENIWPTLKTLL